MTRSQYVNWIEQKWGLRVDESTITRILQTKDKRLTTEVINPDAKRHKAVFVPELEFALKEFVLTYQHKTILSDALLIEKAKSLADELEVPQGTLQFSNGWLQKFKDRNGIRQVKLQGEADSADENAITEALPLLRSKCAEYPPDRIYNMDETGLFYRLEPDRTLATRRLSGRKKNKERLSIALCANSDGSHKLTPLLQPMDAGIIMAFKKHYRRYHIRWMLEQVEAGQFIQDLKMNVLQAIQYIIQEIFMMMI
ncbi:unnamed protein product [Rhizophagus irregularis]|nr:unnamed protein product [Rhizophagus irregularis]CAB4424817.1 unnamed protein product [Rhizophagus irregularis]CAB4438653.1 unnamed protein product [Rhizophagus irregularis]